MSRNPGAARLTHGAKTGLVGALALAATNRAPARSYRTPFLGPHIRQEAERLKLIGVFWPKPTGTVSRAGRTGWTVGPAWTPPLLDETPEAAG